MRCAQAQEPERFFFRRQAESLVSTRVQLVGDVPGELEGIVADQCLLDPAGWSLDALADVVGYISDRPPFIRTHHSPLLLVERLERREQIGNALLDRHAEGLSPLRAHTATLGA